MRYTQEQTDRWISEYIQSGETLKRYSENKPIHPSSLSKWLHKSRRKSTFVELRSDKSSISNIEIRHPGGAIICINKELTILDIIELVRC